MCESGWENFVMAEWAFLIGNERDGQKMWTHHNSAHR